ncbi:hypothetical protein E2C01_028410 [Portunus trituberculatus]|uniref:Uncharacterized protein n=1 Tax=Portunus trituberculatus TaxID=210409 RepID=A0A5B7EPY3_PORTR|nr:hypothetical protein [Portunus trituberculatus]
MATQEYPTSGIGTGVCGTGASGTGSVDMEPHRGHPTLHMVALVGFDHMPDFQLDFSKIFEEWPNSPQLAGGTSSPWSTLFSYKIAGLSASYTGSLGGQGGAAPPAKRYLG